MDNRRKTRVVMLVAGIGERLRPLTFNTPLKRFRVALVIT